MKFLILSLVSLSYYFISKINAAVLPSILWDPRNYLFSCEGLTIKVRTNDHLHLICPKKELNTRQLDQTPNEADLFEKIYLLNDNQYENYRTCNSSVSGICSGCVWSCKKTDFTSTLLVFDPNLLGLPKPKFDPGKTYYLISTSDRTISNLEQSINGSCLGFPEKGFFSLKLKIYVCTQNDINNGNCDTCQTVSCYEKGCGKWSNWAISGHMWNKTHCLRKESRSCLPGFFQCEGLPYRYQNENDKEACKLLQNECNSSSVTPSKSQETSTLLNCPASISTLTEVKVSSVTTTVTATKVIASTVKVTVTEPGCSKSVIAIQPNKAEKIFVDIEYDKKFYITVIATIVGAIFVGIFVAHACVTYFTAKRTKKQNIYYVNEKEELIQTEETSVRRVSTSIKT